MSYEAKVPDILQRDAVDSLLIVLVNDRNKFVWISERLLVAIVLIYFVAIRNSGKISVYCRGRMAGKPQRIRKWRMMDCSLPGKNLAVIVLSVDR